VGSGVVVRLKKERRVVFARAMVGLSGCNCGRATATIVTYLGDGAFAFRTIVARRRSRRIITFTAAYLLGYRASRPIPHRARRAVMVLQRHIAFPAIRVLHHPPDPARGDAEKESQRPE
jgi:hypothetical protein